MELALTCTYVSLAIRPEARGNSHWPTQDIFICSVFVQGAGRQITLSQASCFLQSSSPFAKLS